MNTNLVEAALLIDKNSLNYRIEMEHDEVREFLRYADVYNYIPKNISQIVDAVRKVIGPMKYPPVNGILNPNNGEFSHIKISVGNAGTRVIYVSGYRTPGSPPCKKILAGLKSIGEEFNADENDTGEVFGNASEHFSWRYWWD